MVCITKTNNYYSLGDLASWDQRKMFKEKDLVFHVFTLFSAQKNNKTKMIFNSSAMSSVEDTRTLFCLF